MKKVADLCVKVGSFEKDGKVSNRYINVGSKVENDKGGHFLLINRTFNPAGVPNPENRDSVLVSVFDVRLPQDQDQTATQQVASPEDIVFQE